MQALEECEFWGWFHFRGFSKEIGFLYDVPVRVHVLVELSALPPH